MLIEILTLFVVPTFAVFTYQYIRHIINLSNFPHGPFPLPIIGNLHLLSHKPYEDLNKLAKSYGDVFSMSFGMTRLVVVNSAEAAKEGLVTKSNHFAGRPTNIYTISLLSRGNASFAFGDYSPMWKTLRKIAHSTLKVYGKNYEKLEKWITEESEQLHQILLKAQGKALDPTYEIGDISFIYLFFLFIYPFVYFLVIVPCLLFLFIFEIKSFPYVIEYPNHGLPISCIK